MLMETAAASDPFVASLPVFAKFESVADIDNYRPLPDGWALATADIVGSTKAIAGGRYKTVNMAGASVISALLNALGRQDLPFVFGGDGALVAFPGSALEIARNALAAVQTWVADELDLTLRAAIVPIEDIRAQGLDVRVARFQASEAVFYAMFAGGGGSWAEAEMKAGRYRIDPAPAGTRPDLTGLSCRWNPIEVRGMAKSSRSSPYPGHRATCAVSSFWFPTSSPLPPGRNAMATRFRSTGRPTVCCPPGSMIESRATAPPGQHGCEAVDRHSPMTAYGRHRQIWLDDRPLRSEALQERRAEQFRLPQIRRWPEDDDRCRRRDVSKKIENRLKRRTQAGICRYGLHRQNSALMTCIVVSR